MKFGGARLFLIGMMLTAFLAACQVSPTPATPKAASPTPMVSELATPTLGIVNQAAEISSPSPEVVDTPTPEPQAEEAIATPRSGLTATDPTVANLASGKPTLVEFFAFW
jgi:hypothetical protein